MVFISVSAIPGSSAEAMTGSVTHFIDGSVLCSRRQSCLWVMGYSQTWLSEETETVPGNGIFFHLTIATKH